MGIMDDNGKMELLESRLASRPNSPLFARLALLLLEQGETARAIELCENGMKTYPEYTTGFLVAARCYTAAGQTPEAERALRYILQHHTRHTTALRLLEEIKTAKNDGAQLEADHAKAFEEFADRMRKELNAAQSPLTIEEFLAGDAAASDVPPAAAISSEPADDPIGDLAESLKGAKIRPAQEPFQPAPAPVSPEPPPAPSPDPAIASATLAEIFEKQGQYAEAIATYKKMISQNPADSNKYEQRIETLQQLLDSRAFGL